MNHMRVKLCAFELNFDLFNTSRSFGKQVSLVLIFYPPFLSCQVKSALRFPRRSVEQLDIGQSCRLMKRLRSTDGSHSSSSRSHSRNQRTPSLRSDSSPQMLAHVACFLLRSVHKETSYWQRQPLSSTLCFLKKKAMQVHSTRQRHLCLLIFVLFVLSLLFAPLSTNSVLLHVWSVPIFSQHALCHPHPPSAFPGLSVFCLPSLTSAPWTGMETGQKSERILLYQNVLSTSISFPLSCR